VYNAADFPESGGDWTRGFPGWEEGSSQVLDATDGDGVRAVWAGSVAGSSEGRADLQRHEEGKVTQSHDHGSPGQRAGREAALDHGAIEGRGPITGRPAVFLDRDGVINRAVVRGGRPYPPDRVDDLELLPGVPEAAEALRGAGFELVVVTNQPDVATGRQRREVVEAMHERIRALLPLDEIKVCYHTDADDCHCRKPRPGMLLEAATERSLDLSRSFMVGDRWRDIGAGREAGCRTILVGDGYGERFPVPPDATAGSLQEAAGLILSWHDGER
jgi:D-glycero-D-manno-heptose 1,7-bisphosphate phosphatase